MSEIYSQNMKSENQKQKKQLQIFSIIFFVNITKLLNILEQSPGKTGDNKDYRKFWKSSEAIQVVCIKDKEYHV